MLSTEIMFRELSTSFRNISLLILLIACAPSQGHAQTMVSQEQAAGFDAKLQNAVENLSNIQQSIELKRSTVRELREQL